MPPSSRPMAPPAPAMPAQTPSARLRGAPIGKVVAISARAVGAASAAPAPCTARAASSHHSEVAKPPTSEASGEEQDAGHEDAPAAVDVAEPAAEQQQAAEGQRVGGDDPLEPGTAEAEGALDVRQRDVHDGGVEDDHELGGGDHDERQAQAARDVGRTVHGRRVGLRVVRGDAVSAARRVLRSWDDSRREEECGQFQSNYLTGDRQTWAEPVRAARPGGPRLRRPDEAGRPPGAAARAARPPRLRRRRRRLA